MINVWFFGKKKTEKTEKTDPYIEMYYKVNGWCDEHPNEVMEIRNYVAMMVAQGIKPTSALVEEACADRCIELPFPHKDLLKYSKISFY